MKRNEPCSLLAGMSNGAATVENGLQFLKQLKTELLYDAVVLLLVLFQKNGQQGLREMPAHPVRGGIAHNGS